jgi:ABC-type nitrate/sulfonate/bicarbonate transport system substrate-binding protein
MPYRSIRRLRLALAAASLLLSLLVACTAQAPGPAGPTSAAASQPPGIADAPGGRLSPVRAAYSAISATQATLYITLKSGLFAKHGLDVDLRFVEANNSVTALIAQEVDIATVGGDLVASSVASGADLVILATPLNTYPQMLMSAPEITTSAELRGKRLGVSRFGAITDAAARAALAHFGLRPNEDVDLVQVGAESELLAAMQNGAIQAAILSPPANGPALRAGFRMLLDISTLGLPQPAANLGTTRRFASTQPEIVDRFLRAYLEGIREYKTNPAAATQWFAEYARIDDSELIQDNLDWVERTLPRLPLPTAEGMQSIITRLAPDNPQVTGLTPADLMDPSFLQRIEASGFLRQLWGD